MTRVDDGSEKDSEARAREIERLAGFIMDMRARGVRSREVLSALERVPRTKFLPVEFSEFALADRSLPIACGQVIDRPSVAARLVEALAIEKSHRVLEIGTGSGWVSAILSHLASEVVSAERYRSLAALARANLAAQGIGNVRIMVRDGFLGIKEHAPYERILVGGSVEEVPRLLFDQLSPSGLMVAAVGAPNMAQRLMLFRQGPGGPMTEDLGEVRFVPLQPGLAMAD